MRIYDILQAIDECIDYENGEVIDYARLQELTIARAEKIDNMACVYKNKRAEVEAIDKEIEKLKARRTAALNCSESIKGFLIGVLHGEKHESGRNSITWRKSESVNITDETKIPQVYKTEVVETKINKMDIRSAIKSGTAVDGAELVEKLNIQIN